MEKLLSIIVPIYNCEKDLRRCVSSILRQTYSNIELILVDDGSTDSSHEICDEYAMSDNRVKVIHQKNKGASAARNTGLLASKGQYIGFVDSDDYIDDSMYEKLIFCAVSNKANIVMCDYYMIDKDAHKVIECSDGKSNIKTATDYLKEVLEGKYMGVLWNKLFSKELIEKENISFDEGIHFCEDVVFLSEVVRDQDIYVVHSPLYYYIENETSLSHGSIDARKLTIVQAMDKLVSIIDQNFPDLINESTYFAASMKLMVRSWTDSTDKELSYNLLQSAKININRVTGLKRFKLLAHAYFPFVMSKYIALRNRYNKTTNA